MRIIASILFSILLTISFVRVKAQKSRKVDSLTEQKLKIELEFLNLSTADKIADIGSGSGYNLINIANNYPSLTFTAEDINSKYCNKELLQKRIIKTGNKVKIDNFNIQIGNEKSTNLATAYFTKILAFDVIHEMTFKTEMLADLKHILQNNGVLFIEEILSHKKAKKQKACNYAYLTELELKEILKGNGFKLIEETIVYDTGFNNYIKIFKFIPF